LTAGEHQILHVWTISGESATEFMTDVYLMLQEAAKRAGGSLTLQPPRESGSGTHFFAQPQGAEAVERLGREIGVHRSQTVPRQSTTGRVVTALIGVEWVASAEVGRSGRPDSPVLKTYNYVGGKVTFHLSGNSESLEVVLKGEA
jgi:protein subunit release factor A